MQIVHVCRNYAPHIGGVETHVAAVAAELHRRGHDVTIVTQNHDPSLPELETVADETIWRLPSSSAKKTVWFWIWSHRHLFFSASIVQVHDVWWWLVPVLPWIWPKLHITFHGWETVWPIRWQAKMHRLIASLTARTTMHVGAWIQEFYWDKPTAVIYGGVTIRPEIMLNKKQRNQTTDLVFIGRLAADTGVPRYLELIHFLRQTHPNLKVQWVGDGPLKSACQKVGQVVGWTRDPLPYIERARVVLASSYLALLEAQSLGKVVVAVADNPLKKRYLETFPGYQWLLTITDTHDSQATAAAVSQLLQKSPVLVKEAVQYARSQTWARVVDIYEKNWHI